MRKWFRKPVGAGFLLIAASFFANFLNFIFNAFLGRYLTFAEFGFITLINTFSYLLSIPLSAVSATVTHKIAFLFAKEEHDKEKYFYQQTNKRLFYIAIFISAIWLFLSSLIAKFFQVSNIYAIILFTPALCFSIITAANGGFLRGRLLFVAIAATVIIETSIKLITAVLLVLVNEKQFVYISIPLSMVIAAIVGIYLVQKALKAFPSVAIKTPKQYRFPRRFFFASLISALSITLFFTLDVILAKHYLNPTNAGQYALLSLIGKMIFFFGAMPNQFTLTLISREEGLNHNPSRMFHKIFLITLVIVLISIVILGIFSNFTITFLFGKKTIAILPFILPYLLGIAFVTLANALASYHLARKNLIFSYASLLVTSFMLIMIFLNHENLASFTQAIYLAGIFNFIFFVFIHYFQKNSIFFLRNLVDLIDAFHYVNGNGKPEAGRLKILIFNWRDTRHAWGGGAEVYIHEIAKRLVKQGHSITLFCGNDGHSPRNEYVDGVKIKRRGGFYTVYIWAFIYYLLQFRKRYDVVIDSQNGIPFFTPLYVKEPVFALLFHVHQDVFRKCLKFPFSWIAAVVERKWMPFWYQKTRFITISNSSKDEIHKIYPKATIEIVNPGVDLEKYTPGEKSKTPTLLYLGRLKQYKSIDVLIKAFALVVKKIPEAKLTIAGFGEELSALEQLAFKLGISGKITFTRKVSEEKKIKLMQNAWVFINPSMMEGWGITVIEAAACGTPTVASDVPGLRDSVKDKVTGFLVEEKNNSELAEKITQILSNGELRNKMSQNAVSWSKNYSWEKSSEKLIEKIYENEE